MQLGEVMRDVLPFPRGQRRVDDGVDREVAFASAQLGGDVVDAHDDEQAQCRRVHARFQRLAVPAMKKVVEAHTAGRVATRVPGR